MAKPPAVDIDRHIGSRLKQLRQRAGISAAALAGGMGLTQQQVSRYEHGQNKLSAAQLLKISRCLDVPVYAFFDGFEGALPVPLEKAQNVGRTNAKAEEELQVLESNWPNLTEMQRAAVLRMVEAFVLG